MGRGRTTTGLVSVCLIEMIMGNATVFNGFDELSIERIGTPDSLNQFQYLKGEYRIILQLIAVLRHGKFSKKLTDLCIDECGHVQNLRTTIYDYKLKIENGNNSNMLNVGINFLVRYFYLITFADYLLEQTVNLNRRGRIEGNNVKPKIRFSDWLDQRREITNILKKMKQEIE